jgi:hypothetical protein
LIARRFSIAVTRVRRSISFENLGWGCRLAT